MIKHPAKYSDIFIPIFAKLLTNCKNVLDPFAGTGKLALIKEHGFEGEVICYEIEKEWVEESIYNVDKWYIGDSSNMVFENEFFDAICTSPTYGNRMADHHDAKDESKRITYKHYLGRNLNENNTGQMQWGEKYREKHIEVYSECFRVLKNSGIMIVNISNHIRKGKIVDVVNWHKETLINIGLKLVDNITIETPRMKFGDNSINRVKYENILIFQK